MEDRVSPPRDYELIGACQDCVSKICSLVANGRS